MISHIYTHTDIRYIRKMSFSKCTDMREATMCAMSSAFNEIALFYYKYI